MKKIKYVLIIALVFMFGLTTVFAEGPKPESSELVVGGKILYQKGQKTSEEVLGTLFDENTMTLTLSSSLNIENGEGIKITDMGDEFTIIIDGNVTINLLERNDGIFINNTKVVINSNNEGSLKIVPVEGSGIIVEGTSELHIKRVGIDVVSIRFKEQVVDMSVNTNLTNTIFYKNGEEIRSSDVTIDDSHVDAETPKAEESEPQFKSRDSFGDVAVYAVVAGLLIVCGVVVLLVKVKNQNK